LLTGALILHASRAAGQAPAAAPVTPRPLASGTHLGAYASFSETPGVLLGFNHEALIFAGGVTFKYDGNGLTDAAGARTADKVSASSLISVAYLAYNRYPVGFGPALAYSTSFAPGSVFDRQLVSASMAFYFAPFPAPLTIITLLSTRLVLARGRDPVFDLITPSVLVGYLIW
jgi:hypothetical protein